MLHSTSLIYIEQWCSVILEMFSDFRSASVTTFLSNTELIITADTIHIPSAKVSTEMQLLLVNINRLFPNTKFNLAKANLSLKIN